MEGSGHKFRTSPPILLATGVAIGLMLAAALFAAAPHFTATANQESGRTGALAYDVSDSTAPLSPPAPGTPDPAPVVVSSLSQLLPGLEAKVAAHPNDADLQILLARTYAELGQTEKAQALMESLHQHFPSNNGSVPFARAQALMEGEQSADLRKAIHLFEQSARNEPTLAHLARLHQGQILVRLGDRQRALQIWRDYISTLPFDDERRVAIEAELANLSLDRR